MQIAPLQLSVRLAVLSAAVCTVFLLFGGPAGADRPDLPPIVYVVAGGDTLWEIAAAHSNPGDDVRRIVSDIAELSDVEDGLILPGQILLIPDRG